MSKSFLKQWLLHMGKVYVALAILFSIGTFSGVAIYTLAKYAGEGWALALICIPAIVGFIAAFSYGQVKGDQEIERIRNS